MIDSSKYSEKIVAFLDGELSAVDSKDLFQEMANNHELQNEMQEMVQINSMVKSTMINPDTSLKAGIVSSVGLTSNFFRNLSLSSVAVAIFSLGTFLGLNINDSDQEEIAFTQPQYEAINLNLNIPQETKEEQFVKVDRSGFDKLFTPALTVSDNNTVEETSEKVIDNGSSDFALNDINFTSYPLDTPNRLMIPSNESINKTIPENSNTNSLLRLEMRKIGTQNLHTNSLGPVSAPEFSDFAVALYYNYSSNFQFGVEFGREDFLQKFETRINERTTRVFEQHTSPFFGGLSARLNTDPKSYLLDSEFFVKAFAGGMQTGPLGRVELGFQRVLFNDVRVFAGLELTHTMYFYENGLFQSSKIGPSFGLSFGL